MSNEEKHVISVLFTRYHSTFSNFVYWISGRGFTHASISIDDKDEWYYSFNYKGFCTENADKLRKHSTKNICYRIEVSDESYTALKEKIESFKEEKERMGYCRIGVFLCVLHIAYKFDNHYFCSQFVAEMLQLVDSLTFAKKAELYFTNDLAKELYIQAPAQELQ